MEDKRCPKCYARMRRVVSPSETYWFCTRCLYSTKGRMAAILIGIFWVSVWLIVGFSIGYVLVHPW